MTIWLRAGGVAAFLLLTYALGTMVQMLALGGPPSDAAEAFQILQQNRIVGLLRLDLPTTFAMPLYAVLFAGVFAAMRLEAGRIAGACLLTATLGVALMLSAPSAFSIAELSDRHQAAADETAKTAILSEAQAKLEADIWHGRLPTAGGILLQMAALIVSIAMLGGTAFDRATAWTGIATHGLDLAHLLIGLFAPGAGAAVMMVAGPLYLAWFPLIGRRLLRAGGMR